MRANLLLALLAGVTGCISATTTTTRAEAERIRDLEARVARLEARPADLDEDPVLALQVERASLLVVYDASHPAVRAVEAEIRALEAAQSEEERARRERMARRLEVERETLLVTYAAAHPSVRRLDAQIAFLRTR